MTTITKFSTDTGTVGDNITSENTLTLTGTAKANSTVKVYDGTALLGSTTSDSSGAWSYTTGALSNGSHSFTAATTSTSSSSSGFPDGSTTGVPAGTSLNTVNGNFTSSYAGQIIDAQNVEGTIFVEHPGVIIRNSQAQYITVNADNVTIEDTTVKGENAGGSGINLLGSHNSTVRRVDISGVENGIWLEANGCLIEGNYIHDLRNDGYFDPHYDGLQIPAGHGVSNTVITNNNFDLGPGTSSSLTVSGATDIDISNNRLNGGTYLIYLEDGTSGAKVTNNVFAAYQFGEVAGEDAPAGHFSGNVTGDAASSPGSGTTTTDTSTPLVVTIDTAAPSTPPVETPSVETPSVEAPSVEAPTNDGKQDEAAAPEPELTPPPVANFTNGWQKWNDKVVFRGTAEPDSQISIYDNGGGKAVASVKAGDDGNWRVTTSSPLSDNVVHKFGAKVTDSAGQTSWSSGNFVLGTSGHNQLTGTAGDDLFKGNGGHDTFVFAPNFGSDTVTDFRSGWRGHDTVQFSKDVFADYADVMASASQSGRDVVIDAGGDSSLTLKNTKLASLDKYDFNFA